MAVEASYTPGSALLIGSGRHWLLIEDDLDEELADRLWRLLGSPARVVEDVLAVLEEVYGEAALPSLALVDATPGAVESATRGRGRISHDGGARVLSLGEVSGRSRRVQGGVLYAGSVRLEEVAGPRIPRPPGTGTPAAAGAPLISGIPQHILAARAPDRPLTSADLARAIDSQSRSAITGEPVGAFAFAAPADGDGSTDSTADPHPSADSEAEPRETPGDHDGHTVMRGVPPSPTPPVDPGATSLRDGGPDAVLAVHCPEGHLTAAFSDVCRVCGEPVPPAEPHRIPRPPLGVLRLPNGEVVPLDRGVVLGRKPAPVAGGERWPHLVHLPAQSTYLSRRHLQIELDGWDVLAIDLGSQGGTRLHVPGREPELIKPHEPYVLESGWVLDLADVYAVTFEVAG